MSRSTSPQRKSSPKYLELSPAQSKLWKRRREVIEQQAIAVSSDNQQAEASTSDRKPPALVNEPEKQQGDEADKFTSTTRFLAKRTYDDFMEDYLAELRDPEELVDTAPEESESPAESLPTPAQTDDEGSDRGESDEGDEGDNDEKHDDGIDDEGEDDDDSGVSDPPDTPLTPNTPHTPNMPVMPITPNISHTPDTPNTPNTPGIFSPKAGPPTPFVVPPIPKPRPRPYQRHRPANIFIPCKRVKPATLKKDNSSIASSSKVPRKGIPDLPSEPKALSVYEKPRTPVFQETFVESKKGMDELVEINKCLGRDVEGNSLQRKRRHRPSRTEAYAVLQGKMSLY